MTNYLTANGVQQFVISMPQTSLTATATINAVGSLAFILFGGAIESAATTSPSRGFVKLALTNSTTITASRGAASAGGNLTISGCIVDATSSLVNSVQYQTVTISAGTSSGTATISSVNNNNAAVHILGFNPTATTLDPSSNYAALSLSGTTVTATRGGITGQLTINFVVVEFQSGVLNQNIQNVSATSSSSVTSYTATINSVNLNNTMTFAAGSTIATDTSNLAEAKQYGQLTNSTTLTINVNTAVADAKTYNCTVVEFKAGVLNSSVQRGTTTLSSQSSNTSTITAVNDNFAAFSWLGNSTSNTAEDTEQCEANGILSNNTTVTVSNNYASGTLIGSWEVVEFPAYSSGGNVQGLMMSSGF